MSKTVNFKLKVPNLTPTRRAQYLSAIQPLAGGHLKAYRQELPVLLEKIRTIYQQRITALYQAQLQELQSSRFMFARNCPPCLAYVTPWQTPCLRSFCPFCFGRRIERMFVKLHALVCMTDCSVGTIKVYRDRDDDYRRIQFDHEGALSDNLKDVLTEEQAFARQLRGECLTNAIGGYHFHTIAPDTHDCGETGNGYWLRTHAVIAVLPPDQTVSSERVVITKNPTASQLSWLIGNIFKYPRAWMFSDAAVMADYLNCVKRTRFFNPFGYFKRATHTN